MGEDSFSHLLCCPDRYPFNISTWKRKRGGACDQNDVCSSSPGHLCQGISHLSRGTIGNEPHRIDWLVSGTPVIRIRSPFKSFGDKISSIFSTTSFNSGSLPFPYQWQANSPSPGSKDGNLSLIKSEYFSGGLYFPTY